MNGDGQGSTKYKRPCISENIFLQFFLFKSKTKQKKPKLWFSSGRLSGGPHSSFLQMSHECAKFPNNVVEEPGDTTEHRVCGVLGLARMPLPVLGDSPTTAAHFSGNAGSFPQADSCANLCPRLASTPAVSHLRNFLAAVSPLVPDIGRRKESVRWRRSLAPQCSGL